MKAPLRSGISRKPASVLAKVAKTSSARKPAKAATPATPSIHAGVVLGLALTNKGATVATAECLPLAGRGKIILTGNLVGSARDAAHLAASLARARAKTLGLDHTLFLHTDLHFHVMDPLPQKGGPSIGLPMFVALVSALTRKPIDPTFAFTGELSLTGKVYAVEGLEAKIKAAARAGVTQLFAPMENVAELNGKKLPKGLVLVGIKTVDETLSITVGVKAP